MSSGYVHEWCGKAVFIPALYLPVPYQWPIVPFACGQAIALYLAGPDVDIRSRSTNRLGPLAIIWWPLRVMTRHRGITHNPIVGPLVVTSYLGILAIALVNILMFAVWRSSWLPTIDESQMEWWKAIAIPFMAGMYVQYWVHLILDWFSSSINRLVRYWHKVF